MSKAIPTVQKYMTTNPYSIERNQPLAEAHRIMRTHGIRHLPVMDAGQLVGILSDRDLHLVETLRDVDPEQVPVEDAMALDVFTVDPDAQLDEVAEQMASQKYGSAVVMQNSKVVGIFTTINALTALSELLRTRLGH